MKIYISYRIKGNEDSVSRLAELWNNDPLSHKLKLEYKAIGYLTEDSAPYCHFHILFSTLKQQHPELALVQLNRAIKYNDADLIKYPLLQFMYPTGIKHLYAPLKNVLEFVEICPKCGRKIIQQHGNLVLAEKTKFREFGCLELYHKNDNIGFGGLLVSRRVRDIIASNRADDAEFLPVICRENGKPFDDVFQMVIKKILPPQPIPPAFIYNPVDEPPCSACGRSCVCHKDNATGWLLDESTMDAYFMNKDLPQFGIAYTSEIFGCGRLLEDCRRQIIITQELYRKLTSKECRICAPVHLLDDSGNEILIESRGMRPDHEYP